MTKDISIVIDGKNIKAQEGQSILEAARASGIDIPSLCYHPDVDNRSSCRLCLVEIKGRKGLQTACSTKVEEGMEIVSESDKINEARKANLELLFGEHRIECFDCVLQNSCRLKQLAARLKASMTKYPNRKTNYPTYQFGPALIFDSSKCIDCGNCIDVCKKQGVCFLEKQQKGDSFETMPSSNPKRDCIYCGQCLAHCPVGAFESVGEYEDIEKPFLLKDKTIIVQFAPAIRTSIGEEFGMMPGEVVTDKLVAAIRKLGVNKVFDVSVGADFTTMEEAEELVEKKKKGDTPCLSSCCPAWVKYVEFYHPEFVNHLATTRSPQVILGALIKTYFAKNEGIDPKNIVVISIMPCTAKKYEIEREELKIDGLKPVDFVLTTRELAMLFRRKGIDLKNIEPEPADDPLGIPSGAGVIYGATGGVAESALRTAFFKMTGENLVKLDLEAVRGMDEIKVAEIEVKGEKFRIAVVTGTGNAAKLLEELKQNPKAYDAIEVMACPGGCIGGGGQPLPNTPEKRKQRAEGLYQIDREKKLRLAHESPIIKKVYDEFLNNEEIRHKLCHTKYFKKNKEVNP